MSFTCLHRPFSHEEALLGRVVQSVTCLATDASLTADPGVASSIPAQSHTFMEIDREIISTVILLPYAESFKKGCCEAQWLSGIVLDSRLNAAGSSLTGVTAL